MNNNLTPKSQEVYDLICKIGTLVPSQIQLIDESTDPATTIKFLVAMHYIKLLADKFAIPFCNKQENQGNLACFWAMLDLVSDDEGNIDKTKLSTIIEGNSIVNFSYIHGDSMVINFVYLDESYFSKVAAVKQRFYDFSGLKPGEEKKAGIAHIFVTTMPEVALEVRKLDLPFPHKIALLEGDICGNPNVKYI